MSTLAAVQAQQWRYYAPELLFCQVEQSTHGRARSHHHNGEEPGMRTLASLSHERAGTHALAPRSRDSLRLSHPFNCAYSSPITLSFSFSKQRRRHLQRLPGGSPLSAHAPRLLLDVPTLKLRFS